MERPTLEEQIAISKMSDEECIKLLTGRNWREKLDFWIHRHSPFLWSVIRWNWFCIWCGKEHFRFSDKKCQTESLKKGGEGSG